MAIKRRMKDGTIKYVTFKQEEDKDTKIKRLEALLKEVTETLAGYDKPVVRLLPHIQCTASCFIFII